MHVVCLTPRQCLCASAVRVSPHVREKLSVVETEQLYEMGKKKKTKLEKTGGGEREKLACCIKGCNLIYQTY